MGRITWISAVQEYNKRNKTKVKGRKGTPEYDEIKKLYAEMKAGITTRSVPEKKVEPKKSVKIKEGEKLVVECEEGEPKQVKKEEKTYASELKKRNQLYAVLDKKIIDILEKQKKLETKHEEDDYYFLKNPSLDRTRANRMKKNRTEFKKLVELLRRLIEERNLGKVNPYSMFKSDYKTYKKFDVYSLPVSSIKYQEELDKEQAEQERKRKEKEAIEEKEYGKLDVEKIKREGREALARFKREEMESKKEKLERMRKEDIEEEKEIKKLEEKLRKAREKRKALEAKGVKVEVIKEKPEGKDKPPSPPKETTALTRYEGQFIKKLVGKMPSPDEAIEKLEKRLQQIKDGEQSKTGIARRLEVPMMKMERDDVVIPRIIDKLKQLLREAPEKKAPTKPKTIQQKLKELKEQLPKCKSVDCPKPKSLKTKLKELKKQIEK